MDEEEKKTKQNRKYVYRYIYDRYIDINIIFQRQKYLG